MLKKILKIVGIILLLFIAAAIIIPIAFKGKIMAKVQEEANKQLNANFRFDDIDISLFRNFPNLSVELENLSIVNKAPFQGDTLVAASSIGFSAGLFDLFADDMSISSIRINRGNINVTVLTDGTASYDIMKDSGEESSPESSEQSSFKLKLKSYELNETRISYDDRSLGFKTTLFNLNHSGSGDFTADNTKLDTKTNIEKLDVWYDGVHYLNKVLIDYKAIFDLDLKNSKYSFLENELKLNDLALRFAGFISMPGDDIDMDITFEALQNEVKSFLSLVPGTYTADFKDVKSGGKLSFKGFVKGKYNDNTIPGFDLHLNIADGSVQYPSLPRSLKNMQVVCAVTCPGGDADKTVVDVSRFHVDLGAFPADATLSVKTPVSDPDLKSTIKGNVDLATLKDVIPLEDGMKLNGTVAADLAFEGRMSAIEQERYQDFKASGSATLSNFIYAAKDLKDEVSISKAAMNFNPKEMVLSEFAMKSGKSDLNANGSLQNYLAYVLKDEPIEGSLSLRSSYFDLNPFMTTDEAPASETPAETGDVEGYIRVPQNVNFALNAEFGKIHYDNMDLSDVKGRLLVREGKVEMNGVEMKTLGGQIAMGGTYDTREESGPAVAMNFNMKDLDIRQTAKTFNTLKQLAPIANNTKGTASVNNFRFSCKADKAFNPVMNTVNGGGQLSTSILEIEGFEMIKKVAGSLKMKKLEKWKMEPVKAEFTIVNGEVAVKPFNTKVGNIPAEIAGTNKLDGSIKYAINLDVPRSEFGGAANSVLNDMVSRAGKAGVNVNPGETIPVTILVTGTFTDPKVSTDIKSAAGNAMDDLKAQAEAKLKEEAEKRKQELENKAREEADRLKKEAEDKANAEKARLQAEADKAKAEAERKAKEEAEKARKKAEEEAKKKLKNIFK